MCGVFIEYLNTCSRSVDFTSVTRTRQIVQVSSALKANSHIPCRTPAVLLNIWIVFPIWTAQCDYVCFTHTVPYPCGALTMPLCKRLLKATAQLGMGTALYVWTNIFRFSTACGRFAQVRFLPATTRSFTIGSSDFFSCTCGLPRRTRHCRSTTGAWQGHGIVRVN